MRRGVAELNGEGEVTGGTVIVRYGQNVRDVIEHVKGKLNELKSSLPPGVEVVTTYDRSDLIDRSIDTLKHTLIEELLIVSIVILVFLWHIPSAIIAAHGRARSRPCSASKDGTPFMDLVRAFRIVEAVEPAGRPLEAEVQVITLGDRLPWVGLPGEIFTELGMMIKLGSPFQYTIIASLANGSIWVRAGP